MASAPAHLLLPACASPSVKVGSAVNENRAAWSPVEAEHASARALQNLPLPSPDLPMTAALVDFMEMKEAEPGSGFLVARVESRCSVYRRGAWGPSRSGPRFPSLNWAMGGGQKALTVPPEPPSAAAWLLFPYCCFLGN